MTAGVDEIVRVARHHCRIETLRELAMLARAGITLDGEALDEMAEAMEKATATIEGAD